VKAPCFAAQWRQLGVPHDADTARSTQLPTIHKDCGAVQCIPELNTPRSVVHKTHQRLATCRIRRSTTLAKDLQHKDG